MTFCVVCALVIGTVAWFGDPLSGLKQSTNARDSFYNLLVQGFRAGQLSLNKPVPPELAKLSNPYNPNANAPYINGLVDLSYYKEKFYLYFGVTPV
ncbi:MAG TPA: hypothetical protein VMO20_05335, partial [Candidatus Acidoferrum sp.]|nr:hypothetical protein [Candidatus Acidoferrum sp.]